LEQPVSTHDLVSISYSGNHGYYEPLTNAAANAYVSNPALYPDGFAGLPSSAPDPRFSIVTQISNADYDGLTVTERHARSLLTYRVLALMVQVTLIRVTISKPNWFIASPDCGADSWIPPQAGGRSGKLCLDSGRPYSVTNSLIQSSLVGKGLTNDFLSTTSILADTVNPAIIGTHCGKAAVRTACITPRDFAPAVTATNPNGQRDFGNTAPNSFRGPGFFSIATRLSKAFP
jgi:hypothetical protein